MAMQADSRDTPPEEVLELLSFFVKHYYQSLHATPDQAYKFYKDSSTIGRAEHEEEFSYSVDAENGPAHWGEIREEWSACGSGEMQSPIDLAGPRVSLVRRLGHLNHSYAPANASIVNRGHDIMVRFEGDAGSVSIDGTAYHLRQLHWHAPTEHSVNGRRYDMELHMVHQSAQGKAAVIGVLYEIGARDPFLHKVHP
ncbi:alpha carbonic anhydrase 7-like [Aegilops tauschii subsp. strangulata]|uniref:alpha carbonic anhydrase 7-like n=1 Tax=Aegilops tauschii subsp. strangulata TaxID=200361 RepID=UPI003CC8A267